MNISGNYDYYRYMLYGNSTASISGQQQAGDSSATVIPMDHVSGSETEKKVQSPLASLVEDGTITEEQEEAIGKALEQARLAHQTQAGAANASSDPLASLVEAGTITEEQSDAVMSTLASAKGPRMMAPPPPPPASSEDEEEEADTVSDILDSLVSAGTITDEEKESILTALEESSQSSEEEEAAEMGMVAPPPPPPEPEVDTADISDVLDQLTTEGTITAEQQNEIVSALQEAFEAEQANNDTEGSDPLDSLVEAGTITEAQQAAVKSVFESAMKAYSAQAYSYDNFDLSGSSFSMSL